MTLSGVAMGFAAYGWLSPIASALIQEGIDVSVILNALRALVPRHQWGLKSMPTTLALAQART
jgi:cation transport ATPase